MLRCRSATGSFCLRRWDGNDDIKGLICTVVVVPYSGSVHAAVPLPLPKKEDRYPDGSFYGIACPVKCSGSGKVRGGVHGTGISSDLYSAKPAFFLVHVAG